MIAALLLVSSLSPSGAQFAPTWSFGQQASGSSEESLPRSQFAEPLALPERASGLQWPKRQDSGPSWPRSGLYLPDVVPSGGSRVSYREGLDTAKGMDSDAFDLRTLEPLMPATAAMCEDSLRHSKTSMLTLLCHVYMAQLSAAERQREIEREREREMGGERERDGWPEMSRRWGMIGDDAAVIPNMMRRQKHQRMMLNLMRGPQDTK